MAAHGVTHKKPGRQADEFRPEALLLLGPTGAGKTPLGDLIGRRGLCGRRCVHFDFGENLRRSVRAGGRGWGLSVKDVEFLRNVLYSGALLEDEQFPIALATLKRFLIRRASVADIVVLNGLPRHVGQARNLDAAARVRLVVELFCPAKTIFDRIQTNAGGDRKGRTDDNIADIRRKLAIYNRRTRPLVRHYRHRGVKVVRLPVGLKTTSRELWQSLDNRIGLKKIFEI
ncbi:MAG: nucleoside monophosphate kinase [Planctomycetes bacterium]|nr:nucleoside monophosphate kinase [Planctomycetota bacterium]